MLAFAELSQSCAMSRSVNTNLELLKALVKLKPQPRLALLSVADKSLVTAICECALNILNGNVVILPELKNQLYKERHFIRDLARSQSSWKSKRLLLVKKGVKVIPLIIEAAINSLYNATSQENGFDFA